MAVSSDALSGIHVIGTRDALPTSRKTGLTKWKHDNKAGFFCFAFSHLGLVHVGRMALVASLQIHVVNMSVSL